MSSNLECVYVISARDKDGKICKIGFGQALNRFKSLVHMSPFPEKLRFEYVALIVGEPSLLRRKMEVEKRSHKLLDRCRLHGEWFRVPAGDAIAALKCAAYDAGFKLKEEDLKRYFFKTPAGPRSPVRILKTFPPEGRDVLTT